MKSAHFEMNDIMNCFHEIFSDGQKISCFFHTVFSFNKVYLIDFTMPISLFLVSIDRAEILQKILLFYLLLTKKVSGNILEKGSEVSNGNAILS